MNTKQMCHFCGNTKTHYNHPIRRYTCKPKEIFRECKEFKIIDEHLQNCELCKPIFDSLELCEKYAHKHYTCNNFKYLIKKVKGLENKFLKLRADIQNGLLKCDICGRTARYAVNGNRPCCEDRITKCPGHHKYISDIMKNKFIKDPDLRNRMSKSLKVAQNRPSTVEAKRKKMIFLHNGDCDSCLTFQTNFREAHKARRKKK